MHDSTVEDADHKGPVDWIRPPYGVTVFAHGGIDRQHHRLPQPELFGGSGCP